MALVHLVTTAARTDFSQLSKVQFNRVLKSAEFAHVKKHSLTDSAENADIILFIASRYLYHFDIIGSNYYQSFPEKCFVCDLQDNTLPKVPGVYTNIPQHLHKIPIYQYGFYIQVMDNNRITHKPFSNCKHLFAFAGSVQNFPSIRQQIVKLDYPRSFLTDTSTHGISLSFDNYNDLLAESKFILCPRGIAPSSFRCFEAMKAGRVPVIISDDWFPLVGVDWESFSLHVRENEIATIPKLLEMLEPEAEAMGLKARQVWEKNFSLEAGFNWLVDTCLEIKKYLPHYYDVASRSLVKESFCKQHFKLFWKDWLRFHLNHPYSIN